MVTEKQIQDAFHKARRAKDDWQAAGASEQRAARFTEDRKNDWLSAHGDYEVLVRQQRLEQREAKVEKEVLTALVSWNDPTGIKRTTVVASDKATAFVGTLISAGFEGIVLDGTAQVATQEEY